MGRTCRNFGEAISQNFGEEISRLYNFWNLCSTWGQFSERTIIRLLGHPKSPVFIQRTRQSRDKEPSYNTNDKLVFLVRDFGSIDSKYSSHISSGWSQPSLMSTLRRDRHDPVLKQISIPESEENISSFDEKIKEILQPRR